jgi:23S rRNA A1618 N6-methylase RlmF
LKSVEAKEVKTIEMQLGNKMSRILAWRFWFRLKYRFIISLPSWRD